MEGSELQLHNQFKFLRAIKRMKESKLRRLHYSTFKHSKFFVVVPKWMHRSILERRLFYYFCLKHYHYEKNHPITLEFRRKAKHILSEGYLATMDPQDLAEQRLKEGEHFTATRIKAMTIVEVDRYLAGLSLYVEGKEILRRKVLWEWFNKPVAEIIEHNNRAGVRVRRAGPLNNKYKLRDLILQNPSLGWRAFQEAYGEQMPTVSNASFANARCILKKAGYDIPTLPKGPSGPVVVSGPYGHPQRSKTTTIGVTEDGEGQESEPF